MNKEVVKNNIKELTSSNFFYETYCKYAEDIENKEDVSAKVFNSILISCQLIENIEDAKSLGIDLIETENYENNGIFTFFGNPDRILPLLVSKYTKDTEEELLERLKHGFAVHFTTLNIIELIKEDGVFSSKNKMFSKEDEKLIYNAETIQLANKPDSYNTGKILHKGFGFGDGISMSSQTNAYWMNHTPESLSFLFGGCVYTRDKVKAFEHVKESIDTLNPDLQQQIIDRLNNIWDRLIGDNRSIGAILVDRDGLEYETATYWSYEPPKVEEIRPYNNGSFNDLISTENDRVRQDIGIEHLTFLEIPSISMLEEYRLNNKKNIV